MYSFGGTRTGLANATPRCSIPSDRVGRKPLDDGTSSPRTWSLLDGSIGLRSCLAGTSGRANGDISKMPQAFVNCESCSTAQLIILRGVQLIMPDPASRRILSLRHSMRKQVWLGTMWPAAGWLHAGLTSLGEHRGVLNARLVFDLQRGWKIVARVLCAIHLAAERVFAFVRVDF
jgi:hypothetical protein